MDENRLTEEKLRISSASRHEDAAMKTMMRFFAEELLPLLGIHGKVASIAPTELMDIRITNFYQDFNFFMEDGSIKHMEFQSSDVTLDDLKRFRSYEAVTSYQYKAPVTTYVVCSGRIRNPRTEFTEGVNTYRVVPIRLADRNADEFIRTLEDKRQQDIPILRSELVWLTLTPIMGGSMPIKDRIKAAHRITKDYAALPPWETDKLEAVIYAMADKFLESMDMEEIKEDMRMTKLGQMLLNEGMETGRAEGLATGRAEGLATGRADMIRIIRRKFSRGLNSVEIAELLETDAGYTEHVCALLQKHPDMTDFQIAELLGTEN